MNKFFKYLFLIWFANEPGKASKFAGKAFLYYVLFSVVVFLVGVFAWRE